MPHMGIALGEQSESEGAVGGRLCNKSVQCSLIPMRGLTGLFE